MKRESPATRKAGMATKSSRNREQRTPKMKLSKAERISSATRPRIASVVSSRVKSTGHARDAIKHSSQRTTKAKVSAPRTPAQYFAKPERFKNTYDRVLAAVSKMRSEKTSLSQASRAAGISPRTVVRYGGPALRKRKSGKYAAKAKDNLLRVLIIPTSKGSQEIALRGSQQATLLAEYWNAVHRYLQTGDASGLSQFKGKHIKDANAEESLCSLIARS